MPEFLLVRPKPGLLVVNPKTGLPLLKDRDNKVEASQYWFRRLKDGDVLVHAVAKVSEQPKKEKKKKVSRKKEEEDNSDSE